MKPDEVIVVPCDVEAARDALDKVCVRAGELAEKHNLQPPVSACFIDGHGNQLAVLEVNWDENWNLLEPTKEEEEPLRVPTAAPLFLVIKDSQGKTVTIKLEIEGQQKTN